MCVCHIVLYIIAGTARAINRNVVREKQQLLRKRACNVRGPSTGLIMACGIRIIWQSMEKYERERERESMEYGINDKGHL